MVAGGEIQREEVEFKEGVGEIRRQEGKGASCDYSLRL
jgi:hypothetical protein